MKISILLFAFVLSFRSENIFAQPAIQWQKSLGGSGVEQAYSIQQTVDGGSIVAGFSYSSDGDIMGNHGSGDYWIVKLISAGVLPEWQKSLGGSGTDFAWSIQQTSDGGYIVVGESNSHDGDVTGNHGNFDYWVVKLTSTGALQWQKSLGGSAAEGALSIRQTYDGGYIIAGFSYSTDGDVTGNHGGSDYWVVKLTSAGALAWQKSLGGSGYDWAGSVQQTSDGGYIIAGESNSPDGDVTGNHGGLDYWIVKLTPAGALEWQKSLGGSVDDRAYSIQQTSDGGYIVAGESYSTDGDVTGNHGGNHNDFWIVKLTSSGTLAWQKSLGGSGYDWARSIQQTSDGGYIAAGSSTSTDGDVTGNHGGNQSDYWVIKLTSAGALAWQKSLGGSGEDGALSIQQTSDGGYIVAGWSDSNDGDVIIGNHGYNDYWVVKLGPTSSVGDDNVGEGKIFSLGQNYPDPFSNSSVISYRLPVGSTEATFEIRDVLGRVVYRSVADASQGELTVDGSQLSCGPYLYSMYDGKYFDVKRMIVVK